VAAPRKVAQLDINYARQAKKMDVKKLKGSMWKLLVKPETDKVSGLGSSLVQRGRGGVSGWDSDKVGCKRKGGKMQ
jgi:hypothetical protein